MTAVEYAVLGLFFFALFVGYCFGRASALADAEIDRAHEQRRRDELAERIEEGIAAMHGRPVGSVAEVVPFRRREHRDRIA